MLERVQKIISNSGFCARRKAEEFIIKGRVKVNGKLITIGDKADITKDKVTIDDKPIEIAKKVYIALWKPKKYLSTLYDPEGRKTIRELIAPLKTRLIPVGRLDNMAEGLLLMTNDGDWANAIMHPRYNVRKKYLAKCTREVAREDIEKLKNGIRLDNTLVKPDRVLVLGNRLYEITLHVGLNRVVKRLFESMGYSLYSLMRIQVGEVKLEGMKRGNFRHLTQKEIDGFTQK